MSLKTLQTGVSSHKIRTIYTTADGLVSDNITCLCYGEDEMLYIGTQDGVSVYDGKVFHNLKNINGKVGAVFFDGEKTFVGVQNRVYTLHKLSVIDMQSFSETVVDIKKDDNGKIFLATKKECLFYENGKFEHLQNFEFADTHCMTVFGDGKVYAACNKALLILHGKRPRFSTLLPDMSAAPENIKTLASDSLGYIWLGTKEGIYIFDGKGEWLSPKELDFLPKCCVNKIVFSYDATVFVASDTGVYIIDGIKTAYLGKGRYLPADKAVDIAVRNDGREYWIATEKGLVKTELADMLLSEVENYFDSRMKYFNRENFYVDTHAENPSVELEKSVPYITDNDGLWSALYVGALCYKYACTKEEDIKERAKKAINAILKLENISGIEGFPARAYRRPGEIGFNNGDREWHLTRDDIGELEWKGETSSDELVGHYFATSVYYDLVADEDEKRVIAESVKKMTDHLIKHGYTLCDTDGKPTTWSYFGPEALNGEDVWLWEKGINSLELITFLRITQHMTGEEKYGSIANELITRHHYGMNLLLYKMYDAHSNHIDDLLGILCVLPLWKYETQPDMKKYILLALRRHYEYEKKENNPIFAFIYAHISGECEEIRGAVKTLEEYPLDLFDYEIDNTVRSDIEIDTSPEEFGDRAQSKNALQIDERVGGKLSYEAFRLKGGSGKSYCVPSEWLLGYWLGKYYGFISE